MAILRHQARLGCHDFAPAPGRDADAAGHMAAWAVTHRHGRAVDWIVRAVDRVRAIDHDGPGAAPDGIGSTDNDRPAAMPAASMPAMVPASAAPCVAASMRLPPAVTTSGVPSAVMPTTMMMTAPVRAAISIPVSEGRGSRSQCKGEAGGCGRGENTWCHDPSPVGRPMWLVVDRPCAAMRTCWLNASVIHCSVLQFSKAYLPCDLPVRRAVERGLHFGHELERDDG